METILALVATSVIPTLFVLALPKRQEFFQHPAVKGFGLGVYAALVFMLLREGIEHGGVQTTLVWASIGLGASLLIGVVLKEFHHHHDHEEGARHHSRASTWRVLISDFFHNIVDGIAIVSGFALSPLIGTTSFIGVLGHQTIQQAGQQVLLVEGGLPTKRALWISFFISLSTFLGFFLAGYESLEAPIITASAGIVLWKVCTDILHTKWNAKTVLGFFIGVVLLTASLILVPHGQ